MYASAGWLTTATTTLYGLHYMHIADEQIVVECGLIDDAKVHDQALTLGLYCRQLQTCRTLAAL